MTNGWSIARIKLAHLPVHSPNKTIAIIEIDFPTRGSLERLVGCSRLRHRLMLLVPLLRAGIWQGECGEVK